MMRFVLDEKAATTIEFIKVATGRETNEEAIKLALGLARLYAQVTLRGGRLLVREVDGTQKVVE